MNIGRILTVWSVVCSRVFERWRKGVSVRFGCCMDSHWSL